MSKSRVALVLAAGILISGCGGGGDSSNAPVDHPPVVGTSWLMKSFQTKGDGVTAMHQGVRLPSLMFAPNNMVDVFDGCNQGGGEATVNDDGTIDFGPLRSTLIACPGETGDVSSAVLSVLQGTADYSFDGKDLVLSKDGTTLTYTD